MSSRDDILDGALRQLRDASNPGGDERTRIRAALMRLDESPVTPGPGRALRSYGAATARVGRLSASSMLGRKLLVWGFSLGLATFGIGVGVGFVLGRGNIVAPPPEPDAPLVQAAATPAPPGDAPEARAEPALVEPAPPPSTLRPEPKPRSKPRARPRPALARPAPAGALSLAEALELLHRAERALYSDNAAWAISLLDQLDERAPRALLREERVATRIVAWCADGQVENAERLARQALEEAPTSIYGAILERACDADERASTPSAVHSPSP